MSKDIVLRFAPSPTGPLHIGGVRTALYNYLFARQMGGKLLLRIEDTDRTRYVPGAEEYIIESLAWCGIEFDEGVHLGGPRGPYRQSDRKEIYGEYANKLLENGKAYIAFDTPEEIDAMRDRVKAAGGNPQYSHQTRMSMTNSLTLPADEVKQRIDRGDDHVIRMMIPANEEVRFQDLVRDWVVINSNQLDDKVLLKSDGMPTYHLANIVDDHLMNITHVIRGEEWLPSTPLHVLLYRAFGWEDTMPQFVHLPLILKPDGKGKLSKRDGDRLGFPVFATEWKDPATGEISSGYRESGYMVEAFINALALLGWNPGNDEEIMSMERLIEAFNIEKINKSGAKFDPDKMKWFNQQYIKEAPPEQLLAVVKPYFVEAGYTIEDDSLLSEVIDLLKERVTFLTDFVPMAGYFFKTPTEYDEKMQQKRWTEEGKGYLRELAAKWKEVKIWEKDPLHDTFAAYLEEKEIGGGKVLAPLRLALTGVAGGPGVFDIAALIGREESLHRMEKAVNELVALK